MPFWTAVDGVTQDPKRVSRFKVEIDALNDTNGGSIVWYAKSFAKPQATVKGAKHKYLNHTFNYPGSVEWSDCVVEFIDPTDPIDAAGSIAQLLQSMGYQIPADGSQAGLINISKRKAQTSLGRVVVSQIDDSGNPIETWQLHQPWVNKFEWGSFKYEGDELQTLKLTFTYDWASCVLERGELTPVSPNNAIKSEASDGSNWFVDRIKS